VAGGTGTGIKATPLQRLHDAPRDLTLRLLDECKAPARLLGGTARAEVLASDHRNPEINDITSEPANGAFDGVNLGMPRRRFLDPVLVQAEAECMSHVKIYSAKQPGLMYLSMFSSGLVSTT
jgi:hypothetical protein